MMFLRSFDDNVIGIKIRLINFFWVLFLDLFKYVYYHKKEEKYIIIPHMTIVTKGVVMCTQCPETPAVAELWARTRAGRPRPEFPPVSEGPWEKIGTYCEKHFSEYEKIEARNKNTERRRIAPITI